MASQDAINRIIQECQSRDFMAQVEPRAPSRGPSMVELASFGATPESMAIVEPTRMFAKHGSVLVPADDDTADEDKVEVPVFEKLPRKNSQHSIYEQLQAKKSTTPMKKLLRSTILATNGNLQNNPSHMGAKIPYGTDITSRDIGHFCEAVSRGSVGVMEDLANAGLLEGSGNDIPQDYIIKKQHNEEKVIFSEYIIKEHIYEHDLGKMVISPAHELGSPAREVLDCYFHRHTIRDELGFGAAKKRMGERYANGKNNLDASPNLFLENHELQDTNSYLERAARKARRFSDIQTALDSIDKTKDYF